MLFCSLLLPDGVVSNQERVSAAQIAAAFFD
jgi:hypothetical protein